MMRERPILFSGPMVRAIRDGRKTQTRRIVKPQPVAHNQAEPGDVVWFATELNRVRESRGRDKAAAGELNAHSWWPYGQPGDRLWVREAWRAETDWVGADNLSCQADIRYFADAEPVQSWIEIPTAQRQTWTAKLAKWIDGRDRRWRPSIHMPRWASRLTLEITGVRVQRLQEINEADAIAEGCQCAGVPASFTNVGAFAKLWDSINGEGSWKSNPWVWVIEFKVKGGA